MKQRKRHRGIGESHGGTKKTPTKLCALKGTAGTWQLHAELSTENNNNNKMCCGNWQNLNKVGGLGDTTLLTLNFLS